MVPALAGIGAALLIFGVSVMVPAPAPVDRETGMGGPSEPALAGFLSRPQDLPLDYPAGSFVQASAQTPLTAAELGPVCRPDQGPLAMTIGRRESFYDALSARGAAHEDVMALVAACKPFRNLSKVRSGERFLVHVTPDGGLRSVAFDLDEESFVTWVRDGDTYRREDGTYPVTRNLQGVCGEINVSLYASLQELGAPLALAAKLNDILGWDIDFSRDLRQGDTFRVLYEEVWKEDRLVRTGAILAVEILNRGQVRRAYRFEDADGRPGYYDPEGNNMQKQLMRAPLEYSRISSGFSYRRFHPVLKRWMPHLGVDYAAPLGTPVRAAGDGVIVAATVKEGNGRYLQIRHTNREYETFYLHLSRYAKGIRQGISVRQGQIIGYVGASGYATGPHLDFRVKKSGTFVNPRQLKLPAAAPVTAQQREDFAALTRQYGAALENLTPGTEHIALLPSAPIAPPAWDGLAFAASNLPEAVRTAN